MSTITVTNTHLLELSSPYSRGDHSVPPSHGSRLEDMSNLGVDGLVVTSPAKVSTVSISPFIFWNFPIGKHPREEERKPLVKHDMLIGGDGELTSTVEQPFVFLSFFRKSTIIIHVSIIQLPCPVLMHTEPQDTHGEEKRVLVTTRVANCYCTGRDEDKS